MRFHHLSGALLCWAAAACGGAPPPPAEEAARPQETERENKPQLAVKSELGSVDPEAVRRAFHTLDAKFLDCQKQALDRVEVLGGKAAFFVRIGDDGHVKWTYLEDSEVGDRETEKCLLDVVRGASWPRPDGGDVEARYAMELPEQSTRPPNDWNADKVAGALGRSGDAIDRCKSGANGKFRATVYVGPGGKVLAAGVAASTKEGADKTDCLVDVLHKLKGLPSPGSWPAKVSFGL
jgi:hypothetical protein